MNIIELSSVFIVGFFVGKYINRIRSGRCGLCGGSLYLSDGETLCEKCGAKV